MGQLGISQDSFLPCSKAPVAVNSCVAWKQSGQRGSKGSNSVITALQDTQNSQKVAFFLWKTKDGTIPFLTGSNLTLLLQPLLCSPLKTANYQANPQEIPRQPFPAASSLLGIQAGWSCHQQRLAEVSSATELVPAVLGWPPLLTLWLACLQLSPGEEQSVHYTNHFCTDQLYVILPY